MKNRISFLFAWVLIVCASAMPASSQSAAATSGPDPREIPIPAIHTFMGTLPGVKALPARPELPDLFTFGNGKKVRTLAGWNRRRSEIRKTLAYYAVGQMPPAPGNVRGEVVRTEAILGGKAKYRLVKLSFGPDRKLELYIGIFTPADKKGPFPAIISQASEPPGGSELPRSPQGPNQGKGEDVLLMVGPGAVSQVARKWPVQTAEQMAQSRSDVLARGYALVVYNDNDCAEDTTLREADGSFTFRHTRFPAAYPDYDWGVLAAWAWGASRIADYLETDPEIDAHELLITGASRSGKAAMIAAAFDDRLIGAPVVTGGGGIGAYRFAGDDKSESLDMMEKKYPNWFSPHLHEFWGQRERLPFDEHWFLALAAPRPFLALEGDADTISLPVAVRKSVEAARPVWKFYGVPESRLGVHYSHHPHAFTTEDWTAMMDFVEKELHAKPSPQNFDRTLTMEERKAAVEALRSPAK
ncbi:MAG: hypothetical protein P4L03_04545 [Terracidiphilus sp.]|nr:hypothetical protein [Terracidiphilus sp.]